MKARLYFCAALLAFFFLTSTEVVAQTIAHAKTQSFDVGAEESVDYVEAKPTFNPPPDIPTERKELCFKSFCLARFYIASDGKAKVKLVSSSGSKEIDEITLATLRRWKFSPAMLDGKPVASTRRIKVEFEVN